MHLLTIGHPYVVASNRETMIELAISSDMDIDIAAPLFVRGDLRPIKLEPGVDSSVRLLGIGAYLTQYNHLLCYRSLTQLIRKDKYDLVYIWQEPYSFASYQIGRLCRKRGLPFIFKTDQNLFKKYPPPFSLFERFSRRYCSGWIACGQLVEKTMIEKGFSQSSSSVIPYAVNVKRFSRDRPKLTAQLNLSSPIIVFLGRLTEEKGVRILTAALERVKSPWSLLCLGQGPEERYLNDWVATHGFDDRVAIKLATHDEVAGYLQDCDILVAPSQSRSNWREQFGRMIIEAFSAKMAVIGSSSGEIPNVIGDAGLVIGEDDIEAWANAIEELLTNPEKRTELAEKGHARAQRLFSTEAVAQSYYDFFNRVLKGQVHRELNHHGDASTGQTREPSRPEKKATES